MSTPSPSVDWKVEGGVGLHPCVCERELTQPCDTCGQSPCEFPDEPCEVCGQLNCVCKRRQKTRVKLSDGKARRIQHMMMTTFWHPDGTPISCAQFMEMLFGRLPEFFKDELRDIWSVPDTRSRLQENLTEAGFGPNQLAEMQRAIEAENCDLFDVLAYVTWTSPTVPLAE